MAGTITETSVVNDIGVLEPSKFKVVFYNDDKTPMELVIAILVKIFRHSEESAVDVTLKVHNDGKAVAGIYHFELAEQKGMEATNVARQNGYPLVIKVEAE
jgi:ATP-dependent Clp protease adaptor protein ClpS